MDPDVVLRIENIRRRNISDNRTISLRDLGAGSFKTRNSSRKVSEVARYSAVPTKYCILLANLAAEFGNPEIVEFGTSLGISTMYLAKGCPESIVYTIEGCPVLSEIARENFNSARIKNICLLNGSFDDIIPELRKKAVKPGLIFIDGNHKKEAVVKYFRLMAEMSDNKSVIILDDIHLSHEMEDAWNEIKKYNSISFTIDLFRMGLVFFREGMNRFDYVIRY